MLLQFLDHDQSRGMAAGGVGEDDVVFAWGKSGGAVAVVGDYFQGRRAPGVFAGEVGVEEELFTVSWKVGV